MTAPGRRPARSERSRVEPDLAVETGLLAAGHVLVAGVDEVGRGALAGPVSVGVVVVDATTGPVPPGLRDSKLLTPDRRRSLAPVLRAWARAAAVGHAGPGEVDAVGIVAALRLAALRALAGLQVAPGAVVLDGNHDWLTRPADDPLDACGLAGVPARGPGEVAVLTRVAADLTCAAVAAASVLAKTTRDALMVELAEAHPEYGWASNKGYAAPGHVAALARLGPCDDHRRSWRLPGVPEAPAPAPVLDGSGGGA